MTLRISPEHFLTSLRQRGLDGDQMTAAASTLPEATRLAGGDALRRFPR